MFTFAVHAFVINLKVLLKLLEVRVDFVNIGNVHKSLCKVYVYLEIDIRSADANTTKESIVLLKLFKQLFLLSHGMYDFSIFSFEKLLVFF